MNLQEMQELQVGMVFEMACPFGSNRLGPLPERVVGTVSERHESLRQTKLVVNLHWHGVYLCKVQATITKKTIKWRPYVASHA